MNNKIKHSILVVDDESNMIESYKVLLDKDYRLVTAASGLEAVNILKREAIDLVLLDILMPDMDGIEVLKKMKEINDVEIIMVTAVKTVKTAIEAVKLGAYDYISKPFDIDDLMASVKKALNKRELEREVLLLKAELETKKYHDMVGKSPEINAVFDLIRKVSDTQSTVVVTGESGTGKELIARAIHSNGLRKDNPFIAVDCAAIPENLVESELFGHEKGSFTDATDRKIGKFELAANGTLFLDEIGNLHLDVQSKILRALEEREIQRIGSSRAIKVDARIIAATNIDLKQAVNEGRFRKDLYYRLNVIPINVPPLRERKEDIPLIVSHFIKIYNKQFGKNVRSISKEALKMFIDYTWPGNVRELKNIIERLVALGDEKIISHKHLPLDILLSQQKKTDDYFNKLSIRQARYEFEKQLILKVLEKTRWNQVKAAKVLGIHRNALLYKVHILKLRPLIKEGKISNRR